MEAKYPSAPPPGFIDYGNHQPPPYELLSNNGNSNNSLPLHAAPTQTVINVTSQPSSSVVYVGGCPSCRVGVLRESHCTFCGILWSILLFPIGLLCLCCCTKQRCTNCSYSQ